MRLPSLHALNCFAAAARHGSFTRAAQELALTQGAVSRQVAALEAQLGVELFRRTRHGMALTAAGAQYAARVAHSLDALARDTVDLVGRQGRGQRLQLAAVPTFATRWLIPRLPALQREQPRLQIDIEVRTRPFVLADSGFDAALFAGTPQQLRRWAGARAQLLLHEQVLPVCSPALRAGGTELSPEQLATLPLLQQSTRPDAWAQWFAAQGVAAPAAAAGPRYELFSLQAAAAVHGLGVALLPTLLIGDELASGSLVVACARPLHGQRAYYLVRPDDVDDAVLDAFADWLQRAAAA